MISDDYSKVARVAWGPLMSQAARCARDMGVLEALKAHGPLPASDLAGRAGLSAYAAQVLLEACAAMELVQLEGDRYLLTDAGELYRSDVRTRVETDFVHDVCYRGAAHLRESLERGRPEGLRTLGGSWPTLWAGLGELETTVRASWLAFDGFYSELVFAPALRELVRAGPRTLLDVGGNTGRFAVRAAQHGVAVTVLDYPAQVELALEHARTHGVELSTEATDLANHERPFPRPYDIVWMCHLLPRFSDDGVVRLFERARGSLTLKGRVWVVEPLADRQPNAVARYAVQAMSLYFACIASGVSRLLRADDLARCAKRAGLRLEGDVPLGPFHTLLSFCRA